MNEFKQAVQNQRSINLNEYAVETGTIEFLDDKMLFNPFEKGLNTPAQTVYIRYFLCWQVKTVGNYNELVEKSKNLWFFRFFYQVH